LAERISLFITIIRTSVIGSDCLTLLYAIDVCLLALIERICWERLSRLLR
jgi:hypothetical protein